MHNTFMEETSSAVLKLKGLKSQITETYLDENRLRWPCIQNNI